jgi:hypothetical protein
MPEYTKPATPTLRYITENMRRIVTNYPYILW